MLTHTNIAFACILVLLIFSFRKSKNRDAKTYPILDIGITDQLKGISIILIVFGHLCSIGFINLPSLKYLGAQGVSIFLILSGYGLTKSYLKKGFDENFFVRRFKTVLLPYIVVTGATIVLGYVTNKIVIPKEFILPSILGLNTQIDPTMWYISFIFLWYLAFYTIFTLRICNYAKFNLLFLFSFILKVTLLPNSTILNAPYEYSLHAFSFPIGTLVALYSKKLLSFFKTIRVQVIFLTAVAIMLLIGYLILFKNISVEHQTMYTIINLMLAISCIIFAVLLNFLQFESKALTVVGKYSFEIYLFEAIYFNRYDLLHKLPNKWASLILYIVVLLLSSFILNTLLQQLLNQWEKIRIKRSSIENRSQ